MAQTVPPLAQGDMIVLGGDGRQNAVCIGLAESGKQVTAVGLGTDIPTHPAIRWCESVDKALERSFASHRDVPRVLILPLPSTRDGHTVWCPRDPACLVTLAHIAELMERYPNLRLFGGCLPTTLTDALSAAATDRCTDYYLDEALQVRNAHLTAEAALMLIMEQTDRAVRDLRVGIIGYGRIGHMLAHILTALGASVTVCARRSESRAWAACEGCRTLHVTSLADLCHGFDVVCNTVPSLVLDRDVLNAVDADTLILDLASGATPEVIRECAESRGVRYVRAPSLPGRYAPTEAGDIIADAILTRWHDGANTQEKGGQGV